MKKHKGLKKNLLEVLKAGIIIDKAHKYLEDADLSPIHVQAINNGQNSAI